MAEDSFELALDSDQYPTIRRTTRDALAPFGANGSFAGMAAIVTQEQEATIERMRVLSPISLLLVLILFAFIERRVLMLVSVALPLLLSVGCALGLIGIVAGEFTIMESVFGVVVFGLGIDFAIHLLLRMREERSQGRDFSESLERAIGGTGRGIVAGAVTTGGAFLILGLAPDPVFQRLGLAGGLGLLLCLVFLMVLLPAQWALIDRRRGPDSNPSSTLVAPFCARCVRLAVRAPVASLIIAAVVLGWCGFWFPKFHYETNLERVFSRDIEAVATSQRIHDLFGVDPGPWMVAASDLEEARALTAAFEADPLFDRTESLAFLFVEDLAEREQLLADRAPGLARRVRERELAMVGSEGEEAESMRQGVAAVEALLRADALGPPSRDRLPASLSQRLLGPEGELLVYAFVADPALDSAVAARERAAAQAIHPEATSISAVYEALIGTDRPWLTPLVAAVVLFIALVLYADLRSFRLALLALLPVASASVATIGVLNYVGFSFNTVTLVGLPLLLGLGVDDGIHIVHRMLEQPEEPLENVVSCVSRSIAMTTVTTCASVATLIFTRHPGIESVAILLLVGLPLCLLASVTLLPACAVLLRTGAAVRARA